jgi:hypothetical protein
LTYINDEPAGSVKVPSDDPLTSAFAEATMRRLEVRSLTDQAIAQAYPLLQLTLPDLTLEDWTKFAVQQLAGSKTTEGGILTVVDERGFILGLLDYTIDRELSHGRTLVVKNFVALDFLDTTKKDIATVLIQAMEKLAGHRGCSAIHTLVHQSDTEPRKAWIMDLLETHGHKPQRVNLCKSLAAEG